jgi:hypothetical protein
MEKSGTVSLRLANPVEEAFRMNDSDTGPVKIHRDGAERLATRNDYYDEF